MKTLRLSATLILAAALSLTSATVGLAASLGLSPAHLTTATKGYSAPVTCTLTASADSYVSNALFQTNTNFGTSTSVRVNPASLSTQRTFLQFDLTTCSPSIPSDALVQTATVRLTVASLTTATRTYELRSVTGSWTETGITWNNQPTAASSITSSTIVSVGTTAGTVVQWTSTSDVQSFVTGDATNLGWRLNDSAEGGLGSPTLQLNSREAGSGRPQLVVTYVA
jgi:hypothetical protein